MKRIHQLFCFCLICMFLFQTTAHPVLAAPSPEYVKQMKAEAPLQIIGIVEADTKVRNAEIGEGAEVRKVTLRVQEVKKKPDSLVLPAGDAIDFFYTYIPPEIDMAGSARVNIIEGDQIEIWLKTGEEGWVPAVSGNTIELLQSGGPRPEPTQHQGSSWISENEYVIIAAAALIILWIIRRNASRRTIN